MTEDASEEAAWRDLVAHYATPAAADGTPAPWPTREDLPGPARRARRRPARTPAARTPPTSMSPAWTWPARTSADARRTQLPGPRWGRGPGPFGGLTPGPPQIRIVRPASAAPPPDDDDDHFVPPVPPPLPRLDPVTKGAWVALFGGPAVPARRRDGELAGAGAGPRSAPWPRLSAGSRRWSCGWVTGRRGTRARTTGPWSRTRPRGARPASAVLDQVSGTDDAGVHPERGPGDLHPRPVARAG